MIGAVAGDTIGSSYEFNNTKDYNFRLFDSESWYTDDTICTMAVAKWLLEDKKRSLKRLDAIMTDVCRNNRTPMGGYGEMFYFWVFDDDRHHPYNSWGNGSAMRASACGWVADTLEETERIAETSAAITHNHPEGIKGAQATAAVIFMARTGRSKDEIRKYITKRFGYDLDHTWKEIQPGYEWDSSCQGTVPQAIICFLDSTGFEDAIRKAVSMGGDSDTLACICGGMAEAYYKEIPEGIRKTVWGKLPDRFKDIVRRFAAASHYRDVFDGYGI